MLKSLFFIFCMSYCVIGTKQCPTNEDRLDAFYIESACVCRNCCCFDEIFLDPNSGNMTNTSCCYEYGSNGPVKCCKLNSIQVDIKEVLLSIFVPIGIIVMTICLVALIWVMVARFSRTANENDSECGAAQQSNIDS